MSRRLTTHDTPQHNGIAHALNQAAVEGLRDAIVLRRVMRGESALGALLLVELGEFSAGVLASAVRVQALDAHTMLGVSPHRKGLVRVQGLILGPENGWRRVAC